MLCCYLAIDPGGPSSLREDLEEMNGRELFVEILVLSQYCLVAPWYCELGVPMTASIALHKLHKTLISPTLIYVVCMQSLVI